MSEPFPPPLPAPSPATRAPVVTRDKRADAMLVRTDYHLYLEVDRGTVAIRKPPKEDL